MPKAKTTQKTGGRQSAFGQVHSTPGLLVAHAPTGAVTTDRCAVMPLFTLGRGSDCTLAIYDDKVSGRHCQITKDNNGLWLEDLGSTNGTFLNGRQVTGPRALGERDIIRVGGTVLVFHRVANPMLTPPPANRYGLLGPFHTGPLIQIFREAVLSKRHLLLAGPSGVGKELAAQTLAAMAGTPDSPLPLVAHNAARFTSEDEATSTLFGVGSKVFTNVESRPGLIEHAHNGFLFLDEIHNLPERVQRSLLRVIEDGRVSRIGETAVRPVDVRFVFASNAPAPSYSLAPDLLARLRTIQIPTLRERVADVPSIFKQLLERALMGHCLSSESVLPLLSGDHYEAMCLDGFENDNVRGLIDVADRLATRIKAGVRPNEAIQSVFADRFQNGLVAARYSIIENEQGRVSHYDQNRELITAVFRECRGNLTATQRVLNERGVKCSRRWLGIFAERWGLRPPKN